MSEKNLKTKVGALVLVATLLLAGFVVLLGGFSVGDKQRYYVEFSDSGSVLAGAPVKIAGVRAGRVSEVEFLVERDARKSEKLKAKEAPVNVRISIKVDQGMAGSVRQDSEFFITTQGVLGEKYIEIIPGSAASPTWPEGAHVRGKDPPRIDLLFSRVDSILEQVESAMGGEEELNIGELVRSTTRLMKRLDDYLAKHADRLDSIIVNVDGTAGDARLLVKGLKDGIGDGSSVAMILKDARTVAQTLAAEIGPTTVAARRAMKSADTALGTANGLLKRNEKYLDSALKGLPGVVSRVEEVARDAAFVMSRLKAGRGTVGQLLTDQELYDDLKEMLRNIKRHPWKMLWRE
jgi:phospholipid/cholesterol/gamma-HCH transport system substrate-binding protein